MKFATPAEAGRLEALAAPLVADAHALVVENGCPSEFLARQTMLAAVCALMNAAREGPAPLGVEEIVQALATSAATIAVQSGADPILMLSAMGSQYMNATREMAAALTPPSGTMQ